MECEVMTETEKYTTARQLLSDAIRRAGGDGLCTDECGCGIDDLMPTQCIDLDNCVLAKRGTPPEEMIESGDADEDEPWYWPWRNDDAL